jgi:hypothetical protein
MQRSASLKVRRGLGDRRVFFLHVPKTGGISLTTYLSSFFPQDEICPTPPGDGRWRSANDRWHYSKADLEPYRFFAGHFDVDFINMIDPTGLKITILREPRARLVSMYDFWRSMSDAWAEEHLANAPVNTVQYAKEHSFSQLVRTDNPWIYEAISNSATRQLLGHRFDALAADEREAAHMAFAQLQSFDWFALTEKLTRSFPDLAHKLGTKPPLHPHRHRTYAPEPHEPREAVDLTVPSPDDLRQCDKINRITIPEGSPGHHPERRAGDCGQETFSRHALALDSV